ncbi:MAG: hypothetical protein WC829_01035 [Hyphomicrobium sp.]
MPTKLGDTSKDYAEWRAKVWAVRELPEYKMRKLWRLNYTPDDIANDRHWEVYPQNRAAQRRQEIETRLSARRGARLTNHGIDRKYATALRSEAERMLRVYRMDPEEVARLRADVEKFKALEISLKKKPEED